MPLTRPQSDWDSRYMRLVLGEPLTWAGVPGKSGGAACILVSPDRRQQTLGYSGLPRDVSEIISSCCRVSLRVQDRYCRHAERNALSNAFHDVAGWTAYVTAQPCLPCALELHARRIARVVCAPVRPDSRWLHECQEAASFLEEHGVEYKLWDPKQHSGAGSGGDSSSSMFGTTYTG